MPLEQSPAWPPPMPRPQSSDAAIRVFLKHTRDMLRKETPPKSRVRRLLRRLVYEDGTTIFIDGNPKTYETRIFISIEDDIRMQIGGLFKLDASDVIFELHPDAIAKALNTLPDDMDLKCLADTLVAVFWYNKTKSIEMKDASPEELALTEGVRRKLELALPYWEESLRKLYYNILARKVQFSSEDWKKPASE